MLLLFSYPQVMLLLFSYTHGDALTDLKYPRRCSYYSPTTVVVVVVVVVTTDLCVGVVQLLSMLL